jgi:hypothetical protein
MSLLSLITIVNIFLKSIGWNDIKTFAAQTVLEMENFLNRNAFFLSTYHRIGGFTQLKLKFLLPQILTLF